MDSPADGAPFRRLVATVPREASLSTESDERASFEELVRQWAPRVHGLAYRMLGNAADADDATQEIFFRLWARIDQYDPARPFQPWIYQLATRVTLNRIRSERRVARKVAFAAARAPAEPESSEVAVELREREAIVQRAVASLDGEARCVLAMHYYGRLTQDEVAEVLGAPRSTVQSRIRRALGALRQVLEASGQVAVLPVLEEAMRESPQAPVGETLTRSLLKIGTPAVATAISVPVLGGLLMSKTGISVVAAIVALAVGGGFWAGRSVGASSGASAAAGDSTEVARLVAENRRLERQLADRPSAPADLAPSAATPTLARASVVPAPATTDGAAVAKAGASGIDWSRLSDIIATNADRFVELQGDKSEDGKLDPKDRSMAMALMVEYMRVSADAKALSSYPFFDDRILPDFTLAVFGGMLGLDKTQRGALEASIHVTLASSIKDVDIARMSAIERHALRGRITDEVLDRVADLAGLTGRAKFERFAPLGRTMLAGDTTVIRLGIVASTSQETPDSPQGFIAGATRATLGSRILARWKEAYALNDRQADATRPIADRYAQDATDVLRRRGLDQADSAPIPEVRAAADREMLGLLVSVDRSILALLDETQRVAARAARPQLVFVQSGEGETESTSMSEGI